MSYTISPHIPTGKVLTVTADSISSGTVQRVAQPGDSTTGYSLQSVAVSTSLVLGPYTTERQYSIVTLNGLLSYTITQPDFTPQDSANKSTSVNTDRTSDTKYPTSKAVADYADLGIITEMAADGAIAIASGLVVFTKSASAIDATLAAPTADQAGTQMMFTAGTAKAHKITATGLIQDGITGGGKDTATLAAFLGSSLTLIAYNLKWYVLSLNVCTIA
jgi:hypothetical protein